MAASKIFSAFCRILQALCAVYCVGIMSYFIVRISQANGTPSGETYAVEAICGAAFIYSTLMLLFICCFHRKAGFFTFSIPIDLLFAAAFVAVAVMLRGGAKARCAALNTGVQVSWLQTYDSNASRTCKLVKGIFILSIVEVFLFLFTFVLSFLARKAVKKDRAFGPSPSNNYTQGWRRRRKNKKEEPAVFSPTTNTVSKPAPVAAGAATAAAAHHHHHKDTPGRHSEETAFTSTTNEKPTMGREYHTQNPAFAGGLTPAGFPSAPYARTPSPGYPQYGAGTSDLPKHPGPQDGTYYRAYNPQPSISELSSNPPGTAVSYPPTQMSELDSHNPNFYSSANTAELDSTQHAHNTHPHAPAELPERGYDEMPEHAEHRRPAAAQPHF